MEADDASFHAAESLAGCPLPRAYRELLARNNGFKARYGGHVLKIFPLQEAVRSNEFLTEEGRHLGLFIFGSDGGRERFGFDLRDPATPVVMIEITSAGWEDALFQASSLEDFLAQRNNGEPYKYDIPYKAQQ